MIHKRWISKSPLGNGYIIGCKHEGHDEEVEVRFDLMDDALYFMSL